jgi:hypothetical protein
MNQWPDFAGDDAEEHARFLTELPRVSSVADVDALAEGSEGAWTAGLTDEMLSRLADRLPALRVLASDGNSRVTDAGLAALSRFTRLESLDLECSAIPDAGLPLIAAVLTLRWVDVGFSKGVTGLGWRAFGLRAPTLRSNRRPSDAPLAEDGIDLLLPPDTQG